MTPYSFTTLTAQQGISIVLFTLTLLLAPLHAAIGDPAPDPRYLSDDIHQIFVEDYVSLLVLPNQDYDELQIILQDENARIADISFAVATNAHFSLPDHDYYYRFNTNTGRVEIFNLTDQRVLALPVDMEGLTPWVRVGEGKETRIEVNPLTLSITEDTLPQQSFTKNDMVQGEVWRGCIKQRFFDKDYTTDIGGCTQTSDSKYVLVMFENGTFAYSGREGVAYTVYDHPINSNNYPRIKGTWTQQGETVVGTDEFGGKLFELIKNNNSMTLVSWRTTHQFTHSWSIDTDFFLLWLDTMEMPRDLME